MPNESNQGGTIVIIAAILLVLFLGVAVVGVGGLFFYRSASLQRNAALEQAMRAEREAVRHARVLEQQRMLERARLDTAEATPANALESLLIELDDEGNLMLDGEPVTSTELRERLRQKTRPRADEPPRSLSVSIHATPQCEFRHIVAVMRDCKALGISAVVATGEESIEIEGASTEES